MGLDEELLGGLGEDACLEWMSAMIEDFSGSVELKRFEEFVLLLSWNILIVGFRFQWILGRGFDGLFWCRRKFRNSVLGIERRDLEKWG